MLQFNEQFPVFGTLVVGIAGHTDYPLTPDQARSHGLMVMETDADANLIFPGSTGLDGLVGPWVVCNYTLYNLTCKTATGASVTIASGVSAIIQSDGVNMYTTPYIVAPPGSAGATGEAGQIAYDSTHFYVCIAHNTWVRATLATW